MDQPPPYEKLKEDIDSPQSHSKPLTSKMEPSYPTASPSNVAPYPMMMPTAPVIVQQPAPAAAPTVVVVNNGGLAGGKGRCHVCNYGKLKDHYSCCAICWCILCFPVGCLCCLWMRNKKCNHCGIEF